MAELCEIVREEFVFPLSNQGATLRHKRTMDSELRKFEARFGNSPIKTLTGNQIKGWLSALDLAPKTRIKIFAYIRNAYGIAVKKGYSKRIHSKRSKISSVTKKSEAPPFQLTSEKAQRH